MAILCCVAQKAASAAQVDRGIWCRNILFFWRIGRKEALVLKLPFLPVNYLLAGFSSAVYNWLNMFPLYFFDTISEFKKRGIAESPPPPPTLRRLNRAAWFGAWQLNLMFSPSVKVAKSRRRAGGSWVALWRAFPQTQELVFWRFLRSNLTSGPFSCWYFLPIKTALLLILFQPSVITILCCVAQKAASAAQVDRGIWCRNILFFKE
jgi:hypothetical protein